VLETVLAPLGFATSILFGVSFSSWSLDRLGEAAIDDQRELGMAGGGTDGFVGTPPLDAATRWDVQPCGLRKQVSRAARETRYYAGLAKALGIDVSRLGLADVTRLPLMSKEAHRADPNAFDRRTAKPAWRGADDARLRRG
jgi:hypothetical protein